MNKNIKFTKIGRLAAFTWIADLDLEELARWPFLGVSYCPGPSCNKPVMLGGKHYVTQGHFCTQFLVFSIASEKQLLMLAY